MFELRVPTVPGCRNMRSFDDSWHPRIPPNESNFCPFMFVERLRRSVRTKVEACPATPSFRLLAVYPSMKKETYSTPSQTIRHLDRCWTRAIRIGTGLIWLIRAYREFATTCTLANDGPGTRNTLESEALIVLGDGQRYYHQFLASCNLHIRRGRGSLPQIMIFAKLEAPSASIDIYNIERQ